jgi:shikimate dehydrogenase
MSLSTPATPLTGATRLVAMIGNPIRQAKSPENFNPLFARRGIDAVMVPMEIESDRFETDMPALMHLANLAGVVVTMPFKARILPMLDHVDEAARRVGAVNAARRRPDGTWEGGIFDGVGLVGAVRSLGLDPAGLRVGLIGAGGAGSAIAFALGDRGVRSLRVTDLASDRAADLAARVAALGISAEACATLDLEQLDLLVNASPVGMGPDDGSPVDLSGLHERLAVVDIVTRPATALLEAARNMGCRAAEGGVMVAAQTEAIVEFLGIGPSESRTTAQAK